MTSEQQQQAKCAGLFEALVRFCQNEGRTCYGYYSNEVLRDYLLFHMKHDTLRWVREPETGRIIGCGVAWRTNVQTIFQRNGENKMVFDWQPDDPAGDALFIADVIATNSKALRSLLVAMIYRYPGCGHLKWMTFRHGKLKRINPQTAVKLFKRERQ